MTPALNKSALKRERESLALYERYLPSLDLKRQQLMADYQRARMALSTTEREIEELMSRQEELFALLGASEQDLSGLVRLEKIAYGEENVLGTRLPVLREAAFQVSEYSTLAKPFWVDLLVELLERMGLLTIRCRVETERVRRLGEAVRRITQRVNLFEQVLIPRAKENIQRIRLYLADAERAAVVRSKLAKARQQYGALQREEN